ncbi:MAG: hypothetical protein JXA77_14725 [Bacteroidales bacterium]|nr:hypothetical protein [Bacteroidales bacterium]
MNQEINKLLLESGVSIKVTKDVPELGTAMSEFGYNDKAMNEADKLQKETQKLHQVQVKEYGEQAEASLEVRKALAELKNPYMKHVKIARIALRDDVAGWQALGLSGTRRRTYAGIIAEARLFYANMLSNNNLLTKMAVYGITRNKLEVTQKLAEKAESALAKYREELGQAQNATQERDEKVDALQAWYSDFREIARIALEDKPQYLEMLGIVEPS